MRHRLARDVTIAVHGPDVDVFRDGTLVAMLPGSRRAVEALVSALAAPREEDDLRGNEAMSVALDALMRAGAITPAGLLDDLVIQHARTVGPTPPPFLEDSSGSPALATDDRRADTEWTLREAGQSESAPLPDPASLQVALDEVMSRRASTRAFSGRSMTCGELSTLLWWACGEAGPDRHRTYPSGGLLLPVEVHVLPIQVDGIPQAVHRYRPVAHSLAIRGGMTTGSEIRTWFKDVDASTSSAIILLSVDFTRTVFSRYGGKIYRLALLEAGHIAQNLALVATAMGLGSVPLCGFEDDGIAVAAGMARPDEAILYTVIVGTP